MREREYLYLIYFILPLRNHLVVSRSFLQILFECLQRFLNANIVGWSIVIIILAVKWNKSNWRRFCDVISRLRRHNVKKHRCFIASIIKWQNILTSNSMGFILLIFSMYFKFWKSGSVMEWNQPEMESRVLDCARISDTWRKREKKKIVNNKLITNFREIKSPIIIPGMPLICKSKFLETFRERSGYPRGN